MTAPLLNDAYRTLRDPISRAPILAEAEGFDIGEQGSKDVPPELLEEVFELNMAIEECAMRRQLEASARSASKTCATTMDGELQAKFAEWDASHDPRSSDRHPRPAEPPQVHNESDRIKRMFQIEFDNRTT